MKEKMKVKIKGNEISINVCPDRKCAPYSEDIFRLVGLELLVPEIKRFYDILANSDSVSLIKWVAYMTDGKYDEARKKIMKYFINDAGCRILFGKTEELMNDELGMLQSDLSLFENGHVFTYYELAAMLNEEGFEITIEL